MKQIPFQLVSDYAPAGDQPAAIAALLAGIAAKERDQVLLGVTGSGKTFTMANIIAKTGRPALIMAHNKTLAAQLYTEFKHFFPHNAVEYFVSYYDYYQPEAYIAKTDTFIEKDSSINEQIDRLRHAATRSLIERRDTIVVASVSCIYGLGSPELYLQMRLEVKKGEEINMRTLADKLIELQYDRNDINFERGSFRIRGDVLDIFPSHMEDRAWRLSFFGDEIEDIYEFDSLTGDRTNDMESVTIFANTHHITPRPTLMQAANYIKAECKDRVAQLDKLEKLVESQRISQRTQYDIEMIIETGMCKGIENYSRYLSGRNKGEPPPTLFEYLPKDALLFMDESHVTVSQIGGMYKGDRARKTNLVEHGFRLPSALDNRPLKHEEWNAMRPQTIHVSATPGKWELEQTAGVFVEQIIRPTGLIDPPCEIRPAGNQVDDVMEQCRRTIKQGYRVLITTITKKMAEKLTDYLQENGFKVSYIHSDTETLERVEIIRDLRLGSIDILIGINLLREGLDIPETGLVAILDADKAGFLRSETALIQTIGRAARNIDGRVVLYADRETVAMKAALSETARRREIQMAHNKEHGITPKTIQKSVDASLQDNKRAAAAQMTAAEEHEPIDTIRDNMLRAAADLDFEEAARLRDVLHLRESKLLGVAV